MVVGARCQTLVFVVARVVFALVRLPCVNEAFLPMGVVRVVVVQKCVLDVVRVVLPVFPQGFRPYRFLLWC